jgi:Uma2 family endonuclease
MKVAVPPMTLAGLDRLPRDGNRYELIDGELYVSASPSNRHQMLSVNLLEVLLPFVKQCKLGRVYHAPFDVYIEHGKPTCVQPDIVFITRERIDMVREKGAHGAPDLIIEILSESTYRVDMFDKRDLYRRAGVREYWIPDPNDNQAVVYRFAESEEPRKLGPSDVLSSELLPGLDIPLASIFPG